MPETLGYGPKSVRPPSNFASGANRRKAAAYEDFGNAATRLAELYENRKAIEKEKLEQKKQEALTLSYSVSVMDARRSFDQANTQLVTKLRSVTDGSKVDAAFKDYKQQSQEALDDGFTSLSALPAEYQEKYRQAALNKIQSDMSGNYNHVISSKKNYLTKARDIEIGNAYSELARKGGNAASRKAQLNKGVTAIMDWGVATGASQQEILDMQNTFISRGLVQAGFNISQQNPAGVLPFLEQNKAALKSDDLSNMRGLAKKSTKALLDAKEAQDKGTTEALVSRFAKIVYEDENGVAAGAASLDETLTQLGVSEEMKDSIKTGVKKRVKNMASWDEFQKTVETDGYINSVSDFLVGLSLSLKPGQQLPSFSEVFDLVDEAVQTEAAQAATARGEDEPAATPSLRYKISERQSSELEYIYDSIIPGISKRVQEEAGTTQGDLDAFQTDFLDMMDTYQPGSQSFTIEASDGSRKQVPFNKAYIVRLSDPKRLEGNLTIFGERDNYNSRPVQVPFTQSKIRQVINDFQFKDGKHTQFTAGQIRVLASDIYLGMHQDVLDGKPRAGDEDLFRRVEQAVKQVSVTLNERSGYTGFSGFVTKTGTASDVESVIGNVRISDTQLTDFVDQYDLGGKSVGYIEKFMSDGGGVRALATVVFDSSEPVEQSEAVTTLSRVFGGAEADEDSLNTLSQSVFNAANREKK